MKRFTILFIIVIMFNNLINGQINYGIRVGAVSGAGTTNYGLYVDTVSGAGANYAGIFAGGKVGIGTTTPLATLQVGAASAVTNLSDSFIVRGSTLGASAGNYSYPAEIQNISGNLLRLQFAPYRRADGASWIGAAYRLQFGVDSSFTDGSKAFIEIGGDDPNSSGGGFISLGTAGSDRLSVTNAGKVGIGTTTPTSLLHLTGAVTGKALAIFDETGDQAIFTASASGIAKFTVDHGGSILANTAITATTGTTEATARTNVTTVTLTAAGSFANNDIIYLDNAGTDYMTRIVSGGGTTTLTVSPAVSYDISATSHTFPRLTFSSL